MMTSEESFRWLLILILKLIALCLLKASPGICSHLISHQVAGLGLEETSISTVKLSAKQLHVGGKLLLVSWPCTSKQPALHRCQVSGCAISGVDYVLAVIDSFCVLLQRL